MTRFGDVEVAPDVAVAGGDRGTKEAVHWGVIRRETDGVGIGGKMVHADRVTLANNDPQ